MLENTTTMRIDMNTVIIRPMPAIVHHPVGFTHSLNSVYSSSSKKFHWWICRGICYYEIIQSGIFRLFYDPIIQNPDSSPQDFLEYPENSESACRLLSDPESKGLVEV